MSVILDQIAKARRRLNFDVAQEREELRQKTPRDIATSDQLERRRRFLDESLGDTAEARQIFERIIEGNELMPVNYLERGALAARAIARVRIMNPAGRAIGWGTGFLIAPGVFITNN